jgi:hypothetical protein
MLLEENMAGIRHKSTFVQVNLDNFAGDNDKRFEGATVYNDAGHTRSALVTSRHWDLASCIMFPTFIP